MTCTASAAGGNRLSIPGGLTTGTPPGASVRWAAAIVFAVVVHAGAIAFLLASARAVPDGDTGGAIAVELMPSASEPSDTPDDVAGPKVAEAGAATSENAHAEDAMPPAPDAPPPTETERRPDRPPPPTAPPAQAAEALAPAPPEPVVPDAKPEEKTPPARTDEVERRSAPSRASSGSAAQLEGGRRASPAVKASWAGAVGSHIARLRRYPKEARAEGWQGTARVRVLIDRDGHVTDRSLVKSTGRSILDEEAMALMVRSDPLPKPPAGMAMPVALTVPVNFSIR